MAEINLAGVFKDAKWWVAVAAVFAFVAYTYKDVVSEYISPHDDLILVEQAAALTDDDILSSGYWKLNEEETLWECVHSFSLNNYNFCTQTGSFANDNFVKSFQIRLETEDVIVVDISPSNKFFDQYWRGIYSTVYGINEENWGEPLYVIYFQVGDTDDMRRVIYTKDKNDAKEGRIFTTHFEELILETLD